MGKLALWYRKRLRVLARGPRAYSAYDAANATLVRQGLIVPTPRIVGPNRREYAITEAGRIALREACADEAQDAPDGPVIVARPVRTVADSAARP